MIFLYLSSLKLYNFLSLHFSLSLFLFLRQPYHLWLLNQVLVNLPIFLISMTLLDRLWMLELDWSIPTLTIQWISTSMRRPSCKKKKDLNMDNSWEIVLSLSLPLSPPLAPPTMALLLLMAILTVDNLHSPLYDSDGSIVAIGVSSQYFRPAVAPVSWQEIRTDRWCHDDSAVECSSTSRGTCNAVTTSICEGKTITGAKLAKVIRTVSIICMGMIRINVPAFHINLYRMCVCIHVCVMGLFSRPLLLIFFLCSIDELVVVWGRCYVLCMCMCICMREGKRSRENLLCVKIVVLES